MEEIAMPSLGKSNVDIVQVKNTKSFLISIIDCLGFQEKEHTPSYPEEKEINIKHKVRRRGHLVQKPPNLRL